jgi:hypothetical protein
MHQDSSNKWENGFARAPGFEGLSEWPDCPTEDDRRADLHKCQDCDSELVYPVVWKQEDTEHMRLQSECPDCGWYAEGIHRDDTLDEFDSELTLGAVALGRDYKSLLKANMDEEIDRFVLALQNDHILPEDF